MVTLEKVTVILLMGDCWYIHVYTTFCKNHPSYWMGIVHLKDF